MFIKMKTSGILGSKNMPIVLDEPETDPNSETQGSFNILDLVHKPTEFSISEQNFSSSIHLDVSNVDSEKEHKTELLENENKKEENFNILDLVHKPTDFSIPEQNFRDSIHVDVGNVDSEKEHKTELLEKENKEEENFNILDLVHKPAEFSIPEQNFRNSIHVDVSNIDSENGHKTELSENESKKEENFNILDLVHKPTDFSIPEQNFSNSIHLDVSNINSEKEGKTELPESKNKKEENFNILDLVHKPTDFSIPEQSFRDSIQLDVSNVNSEKRSKTSLPESENKKDWSLKYVPDIFHSDRISNYYCTDYRNKNEDNSIKDNPKKCKKKTKRTLSNPVDMQVNLQNGEMTSQDIFITKHVKTKPNTLKRKKCTNKLKEKINGIKKNYKPIAPLSLINNQKVTVVQNPVQNIVTPINPIFIVKIDDSRVNENKTKVPEYLDYSVKKMGGSEYIQSYNFQNVSPDSVEMIKNKKNFVTKTKLFKCRNCPFMTVDKDFFNYHTRKKQNCGGTDDVFHCPGCKNVFYSLTPLRVHLIHDHKMISKEVKVVLQNIEEVQMNSESEKPSCVFETNQMSSLSGNSLTSNISAMEVPMSNIENRGGMRKDFVGISGRDFSGSTAMESCGNGKRQSMLESYLDDINNKVECNLPPTLNHNGSDLLENTFNFTAPVSEQLPSIQPPPAHSSSNSLVDQSHLMVDHQNGFIGMTSVFDSRDQNNYKQNDVPHYTEHPNIMLPNGNFLPSHIQDIPVINLDDNNLGKSSENILTEDISIEDFSVYQGNGPASLGDENDCPLSVEEENQEEKKKLKRLGVGYRCNINGCKVRLQSEKNIQYHRRCHEGTLYNCPECCKDCSTWVSLSSHLWQAHKIDMELYRCDQCPYKTPSYSRLTNIHRGIHGIARPFLCDTCGKGFKTVKQMRNHKNIHKAKMVRMSVCHCEICGRTVADKRQLELHINNTHKKKKPYLCYMCGYASAVKHSLVVHMRRHTGEKPYECEKCDYKTADHNALRRHKMKHTGVRNYKCNHCSYTCIQASTYKAHIKTKHPGLENDVIFSCSQCNFQTLNRGSFLSHISEHENFNGQMRKPAKSHNSKTDLLTNNDIFGEVNRLDFVGPIISERVVETIVDLSGAHTLLGHNAFYDVESITDDFEEVQELKFKTSGIT